MAGESAYWMTAKRDGKCWECYAAIAVGDRIVWDAGEYHAYCNEHGEEIAGRPDPTKP